MGLSFFLCLFVCLAFFISSMDWPYFPALILNCLQRLPIGFIGSRFLPFTYGLRQLPDHQKEGYQSAVVILNEAQVAFRQRIARVRSNLTFVVVFSYLRSRLLLLLNASPKQLFISLLLLLPVLLLLLCASSCPCSL